MSLQSQLKTALYRAGYVIKRVPRQSSRSAVQGKGAELVDLQGVDLMGMLHRVNPYEGFDFSAFAFDAHGWGGQSPAFAELVRQIRPRLIVEVGTWKGASALAMAGACRELELPTRIVCVDTWLGALEFWTDQSDSQRYQSLQLRNGYPTVYYQFLANVCHQSFQDKIIPFPQTASTAALWFAMFGIQADMVYIDASHEAEDVYQDLTNFWPVVAKHGAIFGDDYSWDGVRLAVNRFATERSKQIQFVEDKWVIRAGE